MVLEKLDPTSAAGTLGYLVCTNTVSGAVTRRFTAYGGRAAAPVITPQQLAQRASAQLVVALPSPATSPGLDHFQLTGLRTWLWVKAWNPVARTATIPGLSATVSARPIRSTWDFGAGGRVVCDGPGTPYDPRLSSTTQSTDCGLTFIRSGMYQARVTVDWEVSWNASTGAGGVLPDLARTTTFPVEVRSAQAVVD